VRPTAGSPDRKGLLLGFRKQRGGIHDEVTTVVLNGVSCEESLEQLKCFVEHFTPKNGIFWLSEGTELRPTVVADADPGDQASGG
jgi:hypothetical protein